MIYILIFAAFYLLITSLVLIRNRFEFEGITEAQPESKEFFPPVSICIPARNEAEVIERCVTSALKQDYPDFEVIVLDDESTDGTSEILKELSGIIANLRHLKGISKPEDWLGKPWACHQLSKEATGRILIFIDADVWLEPHVVSHTVQVLRKKDALTIWPQQKMESFWEQLVIPTIYFALLTLLPVKYVERSPRWMPRFLRSELNPKFTAGCGQFFAFTRQSYDSIGGHESVKSKVVEDMELARTLKKAGLSFNMMHGIDSVYCRMYTNRYNLWQGFQKNFLAGFGNLFDFAFLGMIHFLVFIFPCVTLAIGFTFNDFGLVSASAVLLSLIIAQRLFLNLWFNWNPFYCFLHPFSVLWFQVLGLSCLLNKILGIKTTWKDRKV